MKRFHVSKNFFDKNGSKTESNTTYDYTLTGLKPNSPYTCSTNFVGDKTKAASLYFAGGSTGANGVWSDTPKTFNTNASGEITVYVRRIAVSDSNPAIYDDLMAGAIWIMVNEGSTTVPHEPYGDTWQTKNPPRYGTATDVITSFPSVIKADGTNASADISGNMVQSGTPTSVSPITPSECGDMTENLVYSSQTKTVGTDLQISQTIGSTEYILNKSETEIAVSTATLCDMTLQAGTYTITVNGINRIENTDDFDRTFIRDSDNNIVVSEIINNTPKTFTLSETTTLSKIIIVAHSTSTYNNNRVTIMLNTGDTALPYQPNGYKLDIKSGNTTTPVYLGEVHSTRLVKKYEFTGQENFNTYSTIGQYSYTLNTAVVSKTGICSHYILKPEYGGAKPYIRIASNSIWFELDATGYSSTEALLADFKTYLQQQYAAGTPVCVWYVLAEPTTGILNEPIRKIGDYADSISGITIPTITGADSFDVLTTLKPSEVELTYTGWHDASVKEWDGSDWQ